MTNGEKYAGETHNHYVFERMCPQCSCSMCPREPSELRQCLITDVRDYKQWLLQEYENGYITDNYMDVEEGSIWNLSEDEYRFCANKDSIRLEHDDGRWLEITKNNFKRYFEQLEREDND